MPTKDLYVEQAKQKGLEELNRLINKLEDEIIDLEMDEDQRMCEDSNYEEDPYLAREYNKKIRILETYKKAVKELKADRNYF